MVEKTVEKSLRIYTQPANSEGLCRLYIVFNNHGKQWVKTGLKVLPEFWDQKSQYVKVGQPLQKQLNAKLTQKKADVNTAISRLLKNGVDPTGEAVTEYLAPKKAIESIPAVRVTLSSLMFEFEKTNKGRKSSSYVRNFGTIGRSLEDYKPGLLAEDFTADELHAYVGDHLFDVCECGNNTASTYVGRIKLVLERNMKKGFIKPFDLDEFFYKYVKPKPFWLDWSEVEQIEAYSAKRSDTIYKEEFLFRCYTGLRWSDAHGLRPEHFIKKNGKVLYDFSAVKTSLSENIQMSSKAVEILDRWGYRIPKLYMQDCNERIKDIAAAAGINTMVEKVRFRGSERLVSLLPKYKLVTTHVARRSFARRWMDLGGTIGMLMRYLGHHSIEQTSDYVGYTTKEVNDELGKLMG